MSRGGAGWRRAHRLASYGILPPASLAMLAAEIRCEIPIDIGENSAIVKSVDANVPPDQPPSPIHGNNVDSPAPLNLWRGLSATGVTTFEASASSVSAPLPAASPGCGVTPPGLTY